jgi:putative flippase GtrA
MIPNKEAPTNFTTDAKSTGLLAELLVNDTNAVLPQAIRFGIVGAVATVADASLLHVLVSIYHLHYLLSTVFGFAVGIVTSYTLSMRWVFVSRAIANKSIEFTIFMMVGVVGLALTALAMYVCVSSLRMHYMHAKAVAVVTVFIWNFGVRRALLCRGAETTDQA